MCGIAGLVSKEPVSDRDIELVRSMSGEMIHRGPDGEGTFAAQQVLLAMRRLSIIDLAGGWQPLYNENRSLALVANGEVYNFIELRRDLQQRGHKFATGSDCETILHLYEEHGVACVHHLRGMYAFALYDAPRKRLLLVRDRMGEKPLFLCETPGRIAFASELKALVRSGCAPFELDPAAIDAYFHYQYIPDPETPLKGIRRLPAGHLMVIELDSWRITEQRYWDMEEAPALQGNPATIIRAELERVSELVVRSDVPVGVSLSGGLDSSALTALVVRQYPGQLHAFSVGYPDRPAHDERNQAKRLADHFNIPFHEVEVGLEEMVESFPDLVFWRDTPIADISGQGYLALMRAARREGIPVMLQGQGGDELFWGYDWVRKAVHDTEAKDREIGKGAKSSFDDRFMFIESTCDYALAAAQMRRLYTPAWAEQLRGITADRFFRFPRPWPRADLRITRLICDTYLRENGITQGDRLSMASSVELRLPLLDYRLVETVMGLRKGQPDHDLEPKAWFRAAVRDILPSWVFDRPKRGFTPPVADWQAALFDRYGALLRDGYLVGAGVLSAQTARQFATGFISAGASAPLPFKALILELWCRTMTGDYRPASPAQHATASAVLKTPSPYALPAKVASPHTAAPAPVVLFAYNRPEHIRKVLESLSAAELADRTTLYVYCDGPRKPEEKAAVEEVRRIVRERCWIGQVHVMAREQNLGLARSVIAGVSETVDRHARVIVLEDDLMVSPGFLRFMNSALDRYENNSKVMQVSGYLFPIQGPRQPFFLPLTTSWGWATWKRAWKHFDAELLSFDELTSNAQLRERFNLGGVYDYAAMLDNQRQGKIDSWAIRWYLTTFLRNALTVYPPSSLVQNIGFDGSGTHTGASKQFDTSLAGAQQWEFPTEINGDDVALQSIIRFYGGKSQGMPRRSWLRRICGRIVRASGKLLVRGAK